jgi:histidinol-phosphate aminotransferase
MREKITTLVSERGALISSLAELTPLGLGVPIGANDANFVLIPVLDSEGGTPNNNRAQKVYKTMAEEKGVVVRFRGGEPGCTGCLRITVGSAKENEVVVDKLREVLKVTE